MVRMIAAPATGTLAVAPLSSLGRDRPARLNACVTTAGLTLDGNGDTVLFGVYEQLGPVSSDVLLAVRAGRNVLSVATDGALGDSLAWQRAVDLGLDLAAWMLADPPPATTLVRLTTPSRAQSLRPVLTIAQDTQVDPLRAPDATVSTWIRSAKVSGWPLLEGVEGILPNEPKPESEVLARGHVAISVARWRGERWRLDAATIAWSGRLAQIMTSKWSVGPSRCDCCL